MMEVTTMPETRIRLDDVDDYDVVLFGALSEARRLCLNRERAERIGNAMQARYERAVRGGSASYELIGDDAVFVVDAMQSYVDVQLRRRNLPRLECQILSEAMEFLDQARS